MSETKAAEPKRFSLVLKREVVELEGPSGVEAYYVEELDGVDRDSYLNLLGKKTRYDNAGKPVGLKTFDGLHVALVGLSLHKADGALVAKGVIEKYPAGVIEALFDMAQDLSVLTEATKTEVGND